VAGSAGSAPDAPLGDQGQGSAQGGGADANAQDPRAALRALLSQPSGAAPAAHATGQPAQASGSSAQPATPATPASAPQTTTLNLTGPAAPLTASASAPGTPAAGAARYAVPLQRAVETVQMTIEAGARQGFTQARIQLSPEALGGIKIDLQHTSEGVVAKVVTDHEASAQTLNQGGAELKRSLEAAGVNLVRLDIEARSDSGAASRDPNQPTSTGRTATAHADGAAGADESPDSARSERTLVLPSGALVNVLA
jgi:flagellar hook-length control protein FliK